MKFGDVFKDPFDGHICVYFGQDDRLEHEDWYLDLMPKDVKKPLYRTGTGIGSSAGTVLFNIHDMIKDMLPEE